MIDGHGHPFDLELRDLALSRVAIDLTETARGGDGAPLLWRALLVRRLADRFGVSSAEVEDARREAAADYPRYVRCLFADAGIETIVMDPAWPPDAVERADEFASLSGVWTGCCTASSRWSTSCSRRRSDSTRPSPGSTRLCSTRLAGVWSA